MKIAPLFLLRHDAVCGHHYRQQGTVDVLVIDHVERPTPD